MGTAEGVLAEARRHIGYKSVGINPFNAWYGWNGYEPWCNAFIAYCADRSGNGGVIGKYAWVPGQIAFFKNKGQLHQPSGVPRAGDIVFFCWCGKREGDHVGLVESVTSTSINTIEGNVGGYPGSVLRRSFKLTDASIIGYGRPAYSPGSVQALMSLDDVALAVIAGRYGNGAARAAALTAAGYDPAAVQARVNEIIVGGVKPATSPPSAVAIDFLAREVIAGLWGNGWARAERLIAAGHDYDAVQARVNDILLAG